MLSRTWGSLQRVSVDGQARAWFEEIEIAALIGLLDAAVESLMYGGVKLMH
jgi:hypothetical protein